MKPNPLNIQNWIKTGLLVLVIVAALWYIIKKLRENKAPDKVDFDVESPDKSFDPTAINNAIFDDSKSFITNESAYTPLLLITDNQLRTCYNDWNKRFYSRTQKTLPQTVAAQRFGFMGNNYIQDNILNRFTALKLN